jgi:hypothetical protein
MVKDQAIYVSEKKPGQHLNEVLSTIHYLLIHDPFHAIKVINKRYAGSLKR